MIFCFRFFIGDASRIESALLSGQRVEVDINSGRIHGLVLTTEQEAEEEVSTFEAEKKSDIERKEPEEIKEKEGHVEKEKEDKNNENKEFAWVDQDFIGPRMSEQMLVFITGGNKKDLEIEEISVSDLGDKPIVIVIIKGLGLSSSTTEGAFSLPPEVAMGFSPYSPSLDKWVAKAKAKGHEVLLNIPMETKDFNLNDPGPYALITSSTKEDNITRLKMLLSLMKGYDAVYSDTEEIFTKSITSIKPIMETLKNEGKYFLYGGGYAEFSLIQTAQNMEYPILVTDLILDDVISQDAINKKFREIEEQAQKRGYVVVMARPYPITVRMLEMWLPQVESRGIKIAPISTLLGKTFVD